MRYSHCFDSRYAGSYVSYKEAVEESVQAKVVKALSVGDRSTASSLLRDVSCKDGVLRADDFLDILKYCARLPDPLVLYCAFCVYENRCVYIVFVRLNVVIGWCGERLSCT